MPRTEFSKAVVEGLKLEGCSDSHILKITGLTRTALKNVLLSKRRLTDRDVARIEQATGRSAGQLAALTLPAAAQPLTYIFDEIAKCKSSLSNWRPSPKRLRG